MEKQNMTTLYKELLQFTQFITPERMVRLQILPDDSKEVCIYKIFTIIREISDNDYLVYKYMVDAFELLPKKFRMEILLEVIPKSFKLNTDLCLQLLDMHLKEETENERKERITKNKALLSEKIKNDGTIICYRKVLMGDISPVWTFDFNTNLKQVEDSLYYKEGNINIRIAGGNTREIHIEDVLFCGEENKIYVIPEGYFAENDMEDYLGYGVDTDLYITQDNFEMHAGMFDDDIEL